MGGKVICSTCGKSWQNRLEYMEDKKKCGSEHCPLLRPDDIPKFYSKEHKEKSPHCETFISVVKSEVDHKQVTCLYVEVPKVIVMRLSMK